MALPIHFLGTNGWYSDHKGNTLSTLIQLPQADVILDAGNGLYRAARLLRPGLPCYLFISHFHLDHTSGLHYLMLLRPVELHICGFVGFRSYFDALVQAPYTIPWQQLPYPVHFHELADGTHGFPWGRVQALPLVHAVRCYGYRLEAEGYALAYCTDTSLCEAGVALARQADMLIAECSLKPGVPDGGWGHMNPTDAATMAMRANARLLMLTHFAAHDYPELADRQAALADAQKTFSATRIAREDVPWMLE